MSICIKDNIQNMNLVIGCTVGCSYGRVPQGHPVIVDYFYHEEVRGTGNTGKRNK